MQRWTGAAAWGSAHMASMKAKSTADAPAEAEGISRVSAEAVGGEPLTRLGAAQGKPKGIAAKRVQNGKRDWPPSPKGPLSKRKTHCKGFEMDRSGEVMLETASSLQWMAPKVNYPGL